MTRDKEQTKGQMKPAGQEECSYSVDLFAPAVPVWYEKSGKVSSEWLSICKEERNQTTELMEEIISTANLFKAYRKVKSNGGSSGIDGQNVQEFGMWLNHNYRTLQADILQGNYTPQAVKGVEIPKPKGGKRLLGIPTVRDRVIQQAILQVLQKQYDPRFSPNSFGFRPKRSAHQALSKACQIVSRGKTTVIDIDLEKFFDQVNHQRLMWLLSTRIGDKRLLNLISKILKSGILTGGLIEQRTKGTPQGSPLSPLLSNIVLDELDQELTRRGLSFVRYADDLQIFVRNRRNAERIKESLTKFIETRMRLKVNQTKSGVRNCWEVNFLGHSLLKGGKLGLSKQSEERLKDKIRQVTRRNRGVNVEQILKELNTKLRGWLHYFRFAQMHKKLRQIDGWIRHKLRCFRLKQCKRVIGIVRFLWKLGVENTLAWRTALSGNSWWRLSNSPALNMAMNNKWFSEQGFYSLFENYQILHRNPL
jgi:group II intron reverse transcriptase/maturase